MFSCHFVHKKFSFNCSNVSTTLGAISFHKLYSDVEYELITEIERTNHLNCNTQGWKFNNIIIVYIVSLFTVIIREQLESF